MISVSGKKRKNKKNRVSLLKVLLLVLFLLLLVAGYYFSLEGQNNFFPSDPWYGDWSDVRN